jgi:hypothetical protein
MFDLQYASLNIRKAAAIRGIATGTYRPISNCPHTIAIVCDKNEDEEIPITKENAEYASQFTWQEIKDQF